MASRNSQIVLTCQIKRDCQSATPRALGCTHPPALLCPCSSAVGSGRIAYIELVTPRVPGTFSLLETPPCGWCCPGGVGRSRGSTWVRWQSMIDIGPVGPRRILVQCGQTKLFSWIFRFKKLYSWLTPRPVPPDQSVGPHQSSGSQYSPKR